MQQKLVTIFLSIHGTYDKTKGRNKKKKAHGLVEEHLNDYLQVGWRIKQITALGGGGRGEGYDDFVGGWVVVLLEGGAADPDPSAQAGNAESS